MASLMVKFQRSHAQNAGTVVGHLPEAITAVGLTGLPSGLMAGQQLAALCTASLTEDLRALKDVSSHASRDITKRDVLIPKYADYVHRLREAGHTHDLIGYYLVWLMDAGMIEKGLELALWCVAKGQPLPEGFRATAAYFFADKLLTWAEAEMLAERTVQPFLDQWIAAVDDVPDAWNLPDAINARCRKLLAQEAEAAGDLEAAQYHYKVAFALGAKCKTALGDVTRKLEKAAAEAPTPGDTALEEITSAADQPEVAATDEG
ncbi:phage terminase small subunit [Desulfovibrio falkowii]|uniref:Terminase n=1 Tax=Desulfovibrio falkowii TaxID=3136602 RepID=A0ABQ0EAN8_9BACT